MKINAEFLHKISKERYLSYIRSLPNFHEEKTQTYATLILTLITFSFFSIFAIGPTFSTITQLKRSLQDSKFIDTQLQTKISSLSRLQQQYTSVSSQFPLLYAAIPKSPETTKLTGQIRTLASTHNVNLLQLQVQEVEIATPEKAKSALQSIAVIVGARGEPANLKSFYESLVVFDRLLTISSMTLLLPSESSSSSYRLIIEAQAYYRL